MIRILSTKKLLPNQKHFLLNAGFSVIEADFIQTKNTLPDYAAILEDNLIFTSQNAVKSILESQIFVGLQHKDCFCVGTKTKDLLEKNGFTVIHCANKASDLAETISAEFNKKAFTFFSGNLRQDSLPATLKNRNIDFNEITVYETIPISQEINIPLNAILFFSPSGVKSYLMNNAILNEICFCIGTTTAEALTNITDNVIVANHQTIENVIIQTIKYYNKN